MELLRIQLLLAFLAKLLIVICVWGTVGDSARSERLCIFFSASRSRGLSKFHYGVIIKFKLFLYLKNKQLKTPTDGRHQLNF